MPRPTHGRHRRPKNTGGPAYVTAATLAAFTVGGMNVPGAIGDARQTSTSTRITEKTEQPEQPEPEQPASSGSQRVVISAVELRDTLAQQQEQRASRLREARDKGVRLSQKAAEKERLALEALRPKWVVPVLGYRLTAGFGDYGLWSSTHTGQDFAAPAGSPVRSVGDGTITFASYEGSYGNKIIVEHADGTVSWYAHLSSFERTEGPVLAGDVIGRVGSTGNSTGNHLHLEIRPAGGDPVPPLTWLRAHGARV